MRNGLGMWSERLLSTDWWTKIFSILALGGLATEGVGFALGNERVVLMGLVLGAPLLVGGVLAWVVGVPVALWTRRTERGGSRS